MGLKLAQIQCHQDYQHIKILIQTQVVELPLSPEPSL